MDHASPLSTQAEKIIHGQVAECGLNCYDILWTFHKLEVTVTKAEGDGPEEEAGYIDSDKLMETIRYFKAWQRHGPFVMVRCGHSNPTQQSEENICA